MIGESAPPPARRVPASHAQDAVQKLLDELVASGCEVGIQVVAYQGEDCVVDAWAGRMSTGAQSRPVQHDTLFPIFSVAKGVVSLAAHRQAEKNLLDIDAPIASYWPEFAAAGKEWITLRDVLTHRAGLPQMPPGTTIERVADWEAMAAAIAALPPYHEPGQRSFYHAMTYGWLIGEAVRRTDPGKRSFDRYVQEEICRPLGIDGLFFTISDATRARVATLSGSGYPPPADNSPMRIGIPREVDLTPEVFNRPDVQRALIPAVGAYANAHSIARLFAMLANLGTLGGVRLLSADRVRALIPPRPRPDEPDPFLGGAVLLAVGGYWLGGSRASVGSRQNILFSLGTGGSLAWADVQYGLAVAITHNHMYFGLPPDRDPAVAIGRCVRRALGIPD